MRILGAHAGTDTDPGQSTEAPEGGSAAAGGTEGGAAAGDDAAGGIVDGRAGAAGGIVDGRAGAAGGVVRFASAAMRRVSAFHPGASVGGLVAPDAGAATSGFGGAPGAGAATGGFGLAVDTGSNESLQLGIVVGFGRSSSRVEDADQAGIVCSVGGSGGQMSVSSGTESDSRPASSCVEACAPSAEPFARPTSGHDSCSGIWAAGAGSAGGSTRGSPGSVGTV